MFKKWRVKPARSPNFIRLSLLLPPRTYIPAQCFIFQRYQRPDQNDAVLKVSEKSQDPEARHALRGAHDLLLNAVDLRLKYAPSSELSSLFFECKDDFVRIWGYQPHI